MKERFWLLDVNYEIRDNHPEIWIWGISEENKRILVIDRSFVTYFYLVLEEGETPGIVVERAMQRKNEFPYIARLEPSKLKLFGKPLDVIKVYCQNPDLIPRYSKALSKIEGVRKCLEDDIRYSMRYLVDNDITPCGWYEVEVENTNGRPLIQIDKVCLARSVPKRVQREETPQLRVLGFSMICYSQKGAPKPEKNPVIILAVATNYGEEKQLVAENRNDKELIESFVEFVKSFDPDVVIGYGTNRQHWQYLLGRSAKLGMKLHVDRVGTEPHTSLYGHVSIRGRANVDLEDFADEFPDVKVKTLENIADHLGVMRLQKRTIIEDVDLPKYWDDPNKRPMVLRFAEENTKCIMGIFEAMSDFAMQLSQLVGLPLDQIGRAAVGFRVEWYLIRNARRIGELIPERKERPYIPYAGGAVLQPKPGIHEHIAVLDFKSMYPNIMIEQNISPDTYVSPSEPQPQSGVNVAPEVGHRFRKDPPGFYKMVLSNLLIARDEIRRKFKGLETKSIEYRVLDARQKAIKVITNAAYGYAGWIGARWYVKPVAEATTAWARNIIQNTIDMATNTGLDVIYGDTDSIFIRYDREKTEEFCKVIERKIGLEMKPDKVYSLILFTEAKKRYCGLLPNGKLDIVGLEVVRGDWADIAKDTQEGVLELILKERSPSKATKFVHKLILNLRERKIPYRDLIIWKTLTKPAEGYAIKAPHVEAAKILKEEGWDLTVGDKIGYVIATGSGRLYERVKPYMLASYEAVDVEYYVTNQIIPAASRILSLFDVKEEDLLPKSSTTLFDFISKD